MNRGSSQQTSSTTSAPWAASQPALKLGLNRAMELFKSDPRGEKTVYTGSTVVPWAAQTQQGMDIVTDNAKGNLGGKGLSGQYQDIINQGGLTDAQQGAMRNMQGMPASGLTDAQTRALGGLQSLANNPFNAYQRSALQNTQNTANSKFDINANPAFQDVLRQAQTSARDAVNMSAGGAGRYGGAVHQGNLASEVGDLTSRMVGQEYQNWQNRRDAANQNLFTMGQTGIGTQMNANAGAANIGQQGLANRMNTQNQIFGMGQQGIGNLGTAYQGLNKPAEDLFQVGAMREDMKRRQIDDQLRRFNERNNAGWNQLSRLNAIASGAGQLGSTTTTAQPGQNPWLSAMGYGATGLGLLGGMF